jgi:hypothetical protein
MLAGWVVLLVGAWLAHRAAGPKLAGREAELTRLLGEPELEWMRRFPAFFVDPDQARRWAGTFKAHALLMLILSGVIVVRAVVGWHPSLFALLGVTFALFWGSLVVGRRFDLDALVDEAAWSAHRDTHRRALQVVELKRLTGAWFDPEPAVNEPAPPGH